MADSQKSRSQLLDEIRSLRAQLLHRDGLDLEAPAEISARLPVLAAETSARPGVVGLFRCDREGRCIEVDTRWCEITGLSRERALDPSGFVPDDATGWASLFRVLDKAPLGHAERREFQYTKPTGERVWIQLDAVRLTFRGGKPTGFVSAAILDISDRKRVEEKLRVSEARLAEAQQVAHIGSWEWNMLTGEVWWSDELYRIARRDPEVFQPSFEAFLELIHPDDRERANRVAEEALQNGRSADLEQRILRGEEEPGVIHAVSHVEFDESGKPLRLVGTAQDITERKQAEEERRLLDDRIAQTRKLESLGLMASGIAHDFNNLLVGIMGNASLAFSGLPAESAVRPLVRDIERASARAAGLVSELLAYAGKGSFSVEATELGALALDTAQLLRPRVPVNAELVSPPPAEPVWVKADATQLGQVVMNLITNAADSLRGRSGRVTVETLVIDVDSAYWTSCIAAEGLVPGRYACVRVGDTGCGMSPGLIEKIFDPFYTTKSTGRGLGLAFVLGIVKAHRGALRIESDPERGTVFSVLLPMVAAGEVRTPQVPETQLPSSLSSTVLLIDDDEAVLEVTTLMLERAGVEVLSAGDGRSASELFRRSPSDIDLVMLDINMPGMDGAATCAELRSIRPDIPVLFCSGRSHGEGAARIAGQRSAGFLQKPFTFDTLIAKVEEVLRDSSPTGPSRGTTRDRQER